MTFRGEAYEQGWPLPLEIEEHSHGTGWSIRFAAEVADTPPPTAQDLSVLRDLHARTKAAIEAQ